MSVEDLDLVTDTDAEKLEKMIGGFASGWKATIYRVRPSWCSGYLECVELSEEYPIDLDYLAGEWGGQTLRLRIKGTDGKWKGGCDLNLGAFPPKFRGKTITAEDPFPGQDADPSTRVVPLVPQIPHHLQPQPQPQASPTALVSDMFALAKNMTAEQFEMWQKINLATPTVPAPISLGIDHLLEAAKQIKELQGVFGAADQQVSSGEGQLFETISKIAGALIQKQPQRPQPSPRHRPPAPAPAPAPAPNAISKVDLVHQLSEMPAAELSDICMTALGRMDESKRDDLLCSLGSGLSEFDEVDSEDEDFDNEIGSDSSDRRPIGSNEADHRSDREGDPGRIDVPADQE